MEMAATVGERRKVDHKKSDEYRTDCKSGDKTAEEKFK